MFLLVAVALTAAPIQVAAPGFQASGVAPEVSAALFDRLAAQVAQPGRVRVTTSRDIAQALGLERQRALLGCADESSSCTAELAGALGADALLSGTLVRVGTSMTVTVRLTNGRDGGSLASVTHRAKTEDDLQDWLDAQAPVLVERLLLAFPEKAQASLAAASSRPLWPYLAGGVSLVAAAAGVGVFLSGKADFETMKTTTDLQTIEALRTGGSGKQQLGVGLMVAGGVGAAATVVASLLTSGGQGPRVALVPTTQGAALVVGGVF